MEAQMTGTRKPSPLLAQAQERADEEHSRRLAELRELAPLLQKLDELQPQLAQHGLAIHPGDIHLGWYHLNGSYGQRRKLVRLYSISFSRDAYAQRWLDALAELGFRELRRSGGVYPTAVLQRGHLLLEVDAPAGGEARAAVAKVQHQLAAESAFAGAAA